MKELKLDKAEIEELTRCLESQKNRVQEKLYKKLKRLSTPIKIQSAKSKGRNFQYEVCQMIADAFFFKYDQHDPDCLIHSNEMGQSGVDIILRGEARKRFPFSVECKNQESLKITEWVEQAQHNQAEGTQWAVVFKKKSLKNPLVLLDFKSFLDYI